MKEMDIPATEKQEMYLLKLGIDWTEELTQEKASKMIREYLEEHPEARKSVPMTDKQYEALCKAGVEVDGTENFEFAEKQLRKLPPTEKQLGLIRRWCNDESLLKTLNRGKASDIIRDKFAENAKRRDMPATKEQMAYIRKRGYKMDKPMTVAQASYAISQLPPTDAQLNYFKRNEINYDRDIRFGQAYKTISDYVNLGEKGKLEPATEKQLAWCHFHNVETKPGMTKGEAQVMINAIIKKHQAERQGERPKLVPIKKRATSKGKTARSSATKAKAKEPVKNAKKEASKQPAKYNRAKADFLSNIMARVHQEAARRKEVVAQQEKAAKTVAAKKAVKKRTVTRSGANKKTEQDKGQTLELSVAR